MPELVHFNRADSLDDIFAGLDRDGGVVIDGFIDAEIADALAADFQSQLDNVPWGNKPAGRASACTSATSRAG